MNFELSLIQKLSGIVSLSHEQGKQLRRHFDHLQYWNEKMNLTSVTGLEEILERHYCESLFLAAHLPAGPHTIVDVGSGAGFPGVPVGVYRSDCPITLSESHQRKAVFLREATRDLSNVRVVCRRAEDIETHFDWLISRAVGSAALKRILPKLADHVALLIGRNDLAEYPRGSVIPLPWGEQRLLLMFHVKHAT